MTSPDIWQIGTGDPSRPFFKTMDQYGVALIGPGAPGKWPSEAYQETPSVGRFAGGPNRGDLVIARQGVRRALAVGVLGDYDWCDSFDDVEGWDLQHYRPVRWLEDIERRNFDGKPFPRSRFSRVHSEEVRNWVDRETDGRSLDPPAGPIGFPSTAGALDVAGLVPAVAEVVNRAVWYREFTWSGNLGAIPSEQELLTNVTVPLLVALNWDRVQLAIGWRYTDIAAFDPSKREPENCRLLVEGKRIGDGLGFAVDQADRYVRELEMTEAPVLLTDGLRYRLRVDGGEGDGDARFLYANLARPKEDVLALFDALRHH